MTVELYNDMVILISLGLHIGQSWTDLIPDKTEGFKIEILPNKTELII